MSRITSYLEQQFWCPENVITEILQMFICSLIAVGVHDRSRASDGETIILNETVLSHQTAASHTHIIGCVVCTRSSISYPLRLANVETVADGSTGQLALLLEAHCHKRQKYD